MNRRRKCPSTASNAASSRCAAFAVEAADRSAQPVDRLAQLVALGERCGTAGLELGQLALGDEIDRAEPLAVGRQAGRAARIRWRRHVPRRCRSRPSRAAAAADIRSARPRRGPSRSAALPDSRRAPPRRRAPRGPSDSASAAADDACSVSRNLLSADRVLGEHRLGGARRCCGLASAALRADGRASPALPASVSASTSAARARFIISSIRFAASPARARQPFASAAAAAGALAVGRDRPVERRGVSLQLSDTLARRLARSPQRATEPRCRRTVGKRTRRRLAPRRARPGRSARSAAMRATRASSSSRRAASRSIAVGCGLHRAGARAPGLGLSKRASARLRLPRAQPARAVWASASRGAYALDRTRRGGQLALDLGEAVDSDQPLGGGRALIVGDIAVPAPQPAVARHQPLAHGERLAVVAFGDADLREPPRQFGAARRPWPKAALGRSAALDRSAGRRSGPTASAGAAKPGVEIVAQRGRERALIARPARTLVEHPVAARAASASVNAAASLSSAASALAPTRARAPPRRAAPDASTRAASAPSIAERRLLGCWLGSVRARRSRASRRASSGAASPSANSFAAPAAPSSRSARSSRVRGRGERGLRDARLGLLARLLGERLRQRDLGVARRRFGREQRFARIRARAPRRRRSAPRAPCPPPVSRAIASAASCASAPSRAAIGLAAARPLAASSAMRRSSAARSVRSVAELMPQLARLFARRQARRIAHAASACVASPAQAAAARCASAGLRQPTPRRPTPRLSLRRPQRRRRASGHRSAAPRRRGSASDSVR